MSKNKLISIVTPLFNEENNVEELCLRITAVMSQSDYDYEHICIDNASTDSTLELLKKRALKDKNLKIIVNARNFGYIRSSFHALLQANGDAIVLIASDLQDPPEMILEFIKKWESGYKSILAVKTASEESSLMFWLRGLYYKLISSASEIPLINNATGSGLFDRIVIDAIRELNDPYPYFRGLVCEIGYSIATVPFTQPKRSRGITKNNFYSLFDFAMLGLTKHSKVPLRVMTILGFCLSMISLFIGFGYLSAKLLFWNSFSIGIAPIIIGGLFLGSFQLFFLGILGEYVGSIQIQVRNLPHVIESERVNF